MHSAMRGYRKSGINHCNRYIFTDECFTAAGVTDKREPDPQQSTNAARDVQPDPQQSTNAALDVQPDPTPSTIVALGV